MEKTMFYRIEEDGPKRIEERQFLQEKTGVCFLTMEQWKRESKWRETFGIWHRIDHFHYCKVENYEKFLYGTLRIPAKKKRDFDVAVAFYITKQWVIFVEERKNAEELLCNYIKGIVAKEYSLEKFILGFFQYILQDDLLFLEGLELEIANLEEEILKGDIEDFSYKILQIKKMMGKFYHYYSQLTEMGNEMCQQGKGILEGEDWSEIHLYIDKTWRLSAETQSLREYAMQVQEVYQAQIAIMQNNVMKILTIVTTIFLPLTLIAGWYGMNFEYMPELQSVYGYPIIICISIIIVIVSLVLFKRRKYW